MHAPCAARFRREFGAACPTCRAAVASPRALERRPDAPREERRVRRAQRRVAREREREARARARAWPRAVWPIARWVVGRHAGVRTALNRLVRDDAARFLRRSRDAGCDDPQALLRDVEWVERRYDLLSAATRERLRQQWQAALDDAA